MGCTFNAGVVPSAPMSKNHQDAPRLGHLYPELDVEPLKEAKRSLGAYARSAFRVWRRLANESEAVEDSLRDATHRTGLHVGATRATEGNRGSKWGFAAGGEGSNTDFRKIEASNSP